MNIAILDNDSVVVEITTTSSALADFPSIITPINIDNIAPPSIGDIWNGTSFITVGVTPALQYRSFTYVEFMQALGTEMPVRAAAVIRQKNTDTDIGAHIELVFEIIKSNGGVNFNVEIARTNFALLVVLSVFTQAESDTLMNNPNYVAP